MTSFLAQCPECLTSFRVSDNQLDAAAGMVRCGACLSVFSAPSNRIKIRRHADQIDEPGETDEARESDMDLLPVDTVVPAQTPGHEDEDEDEDDDLWMEHERDRDVPLGDLDLDLELDEHHEATDDDFDDDMDDASEAEEAEVAIEEYADEEEFVEDDGDEDENENENENENDEDDELQDDELTGEFVEVFDIPEELRISGGTEEFDESGELEEIDGLDDFDEMDEPEESDELEEIDGLDDFDDTDEPEESDQPEAFDGLDEFTAMDEPDNVDQAKESPPRRISGIHDAFQSSESVVLYELPELSEAEEEAGFAEIAFHAGVLPVPPGRHEPPATNEIVENDSNDAIDAIEANDSKSKANNDKNKKAPPISRWRNPARIAGDRQEVQDYLAALDDDDALEPLPEAALDHFTDEPVTISAHQHARRRRLRFILLMLASLLLFGLLALQYINANLDTFMRAERLAPLMDQLCKVLECPVPERGDLGSFSTQDLLVRSHPRFTGALEVSFIFSNDAAAEQAFPAIELAFSDLDKRLLANRLFQPADYLPAELQQVPAMPAQSTLQVTLELADPGNDAVNWSLGFRQAAL